ncbi:MAG: DJ-1/PfpI family protein [Acidobacteriota bacterium]
MNIAILVYPGMTALDAIGPYEVLNGIPDVELQFVWKTIGPVMTDSGVLAIGATHTFDEIKRADIVVVPGSSADTVTMMADSQVLMWLKEIHLTTRFTTSVCSGALILAAAGLLKGLPATTHWAAMSALRKFGAEPMPNERVVQSGKIITAAGVSAGIDMALHLVAQVCGEERARIIQLLIEYDPRPPFDSGHMSKADTRIAETARSEMSRRAANPRNLVSVPKLLASQWLARITHR